MNIAIRKSNQLTAFLMLIATGIFMELKSFILTPLTFAKSVAVHEGGAINTAGFILIAVGFILIVFAMNFLTIIYSTAATNGALASVPSFPGTKNINDQIPMVVTAAVLLIGVAMLGLGGYVIAKSVGKM